MTLRSKLSSDGFRFPLAVFAGSRLAIFLTASWSLLLDPRMHTGNNYDVLPLESLCRWDCIWYAHIAGAGYDQAWLTNFFPLLPLLGRALHLILPLPYSFLMVLLANVFGLGALVAIYGVFRALAKEEEARATLVLWAFWPFSFFQAAGYPESLMALTTALAARYALERRHWSAAVALGVGVLSRHLALAAGPLLAVAQAKERGSSLRSLVFNRSTLALFLPLLVGGLYPAFLWLRFGHPMLWLEARSVWGPGAWAGMGQFLRGEIDQPQVQLYVLLAAIPTVGALALWRQRATWELAAYGATLMATVWAIGLMGLGRYSGAAWPAFLPLGAWMARRPALYAPCVGLFAALQCVFVYLFAHAYPIL